MPLISLDLAPDDQITVTLPSGRTILVPLSPTGLAMIGQLLTAAKANERRFGTIAAPAQAQVHGILAALEAAPASAAGIAAIRERVPKCIAQPGAVPYPAGIAPSDNTVTVRRIPRGHSAIAEARKAEQRAKRAKPALADLLADFGAPPPRR